MTQEKVKLELVKATLEGKIAGLQNSLNSLGDLVYPELTKKITFTLTELEEVLKVIKETK